MITAARPTPSPLLVDARAEAASVPVCMLAMPVVTIPVIVITIGMYREPLLLSAQRGRWKLLEALVAMWCALRAGITV